MKATSIGACLMIVVVPPSLSPSFSTESQVENPPGTQNEPRNLTVGVPRESQIFAFNSKQIFQDRDQLRIGSVLEAQEEFSFVDKDLIQRLQFRAVVVSCKLGQLCD